MGTDRREYQRVTLSHPLEYRLEKEAGGVSWQGALMVGISATGLRAMSEQALAPGARLELRFRFPHHAEPYQFLGEVVWSRPVSDLTESGIAFIDVTTSQRDDLDELVQFLLKTPGTA